MKKEKYIVFSVYRTSYLLWSPVIIIFRNILNPFGASEEKYDDNKWREYPSRIMRADHSSNQDPWYTQKPTYYSIYTIQIRSWILRSPALVVQRQSHEPAQAIHNKHTYRHCRGVDEVGGRTRSTMPGDLTRTQHDTHRTWYRRVDVYYCCTIPPPILPYTVRGNISTATRTKNGV